MNCPACQHANGSDDVFCSECGAALMANCASCGAELKPGAKFCSKCGASTTASKTEPLPTRAIADYTPKHLVDKILNSRSALEGERKQVTVLFADVKGSMNLAARLDPEDWHRILERFFSILTEGVHRFEGTVNQYTGDGAMALFGAPIAQEDHAQRACYAALQMREDLRRYAIELRLERGLDFGVRIGINSGEVVVGKIGDDLRMDYTAQGHTVGVAQRLEQIAESGRVYVSEHTARLVEGFFRLSDLGRSNLSDAEEALAVFDLDGTTTARSRLDISRARGLTQFVGREDEMRILETALERVKAGHGQVVGVVGEPGLGKSRLCFEFAERCRVQGVPVYEAHCPAHGKTIPFIPILELFRNYFDISEQDSAGQARQKIAGALVLLDPTLHEGMPVLFDFLGVDDPDRPAPQLDADARQRQLFDLLHKLVRARSERGMASVTFIDDLHWVDSWSDAFVAQLVEAAENSHALVLVNFRPEYQAAWNGRAHYQQLPLIPLGPEALQEMVETLLGDDASVTRLTEKIMHWTGGNPLYTEEVINTLIETGQLEGKRGAYRLSRDVDLLEVPLNVQAIIAARIDRLDETSKHVLQAASVAGKVFSRPLIEKITDTAAADLAAALERLKAVDFVYETSLYPVVEYSFKHPLVHEVAYETQLREQRAARHAAVAAAIEELEVQRIDEFSSMLAYHWERAGIPEQALNWHRKAAEIANVKDPASALEHWEKVRGLVDELEPSTEIFTIGAEACGQISNLWWRLGATEDQARAYFEDGISLAERAGNTALKAVLTGSYSALRGISQGYANDYATYGEEAARLADLTNDEELQCCERNWVVFGYIFSGRFQEAIDLANKVLEKIPDEAYWGARYTGFSIRWSLLMGVGLTNCYLGDYSRAREFIRKAHAQTNKIPEFVSFTHIPREHRVCLLREF